MASIVSNQLSIWTSEDGTQGGDGIQGQLKFKPGSIMMGLRLRGYTHVALVPMTVSTSLIGIYPRKSARGSCGQVVRPLHYKDHGGLFVDVPDLWWCERWRHLLTGKGWVPVDLRVGARDAGFSMRVLLPEASVLDAAEKRLASLPSYPSKD